MHTTTIIIITIRISSYKLQKKKNNNKYRHIKKDVYISLEGSLILLSCTVPVVVESHSSSEAASKIVRIVANII